MIIGYISYLLPGAVRLSRTTKSLSQEDIKRHLTSAKNSEAFASCTYCYLPEKTRNHEVNLEYSKCIQKMPLTQKCYDAITTPLWAKNKRTGKKELTFASMPSRSALKEAGLTLVKYAELAPYSKLIVYFSDIASDLKAIDYRVELLPV